MDVQLKHSFQGQSIAILLIPIILIRADSLTLVSLRGSRPLCVMMLPFMAAWRPSCEALRPMELTWPVTWPVTWRSSKVQSANSDDARRGGTFFEQLMLLVVLYRYELY